LGRALKVPTLRPPLALAGGNFASDGAGRCFTSTRAIVANGGERDRLNATLRLYLGCERVVYLEPLPGPTTKHIDMFFRVARPGVVLLAEYEAPPNRHTAAGHLQARARAVMERNAEIQRHAAANDGVELEIIRVPTPPITPLDQAPFQSDEARAALEGPGHADPAGRPGGLERQLRDEHFVYRSFLNYVHLRTQSDDLLLVPSYPNAVDPGHAEQRAGAALRRAYPQSRIVPIDAERLIAKQGALHCATWAVPDSVDSSALFESREATAAARPAAADAADGERAN
jgi:agmatine/peptidylarginine deiminase